MNIPARMPQQSEPLKISAISNPVFRVELPNGTIETYDPFELIEKVTIANADLMDAKPEYAGTMLPPEATSGELPPDAKPRRPETFHEVLLAEFHLKESDFPGLSARNVMLSLWAAVNEYLEGLEVTKKLSGLVQRSLSSQASSPQK